MSSQSRVEPPKPNVTVVEIWDPSTAGEDIEVIHQDLVQLRSEPLRGRRVIVYLEPAVLIYHSTNLAVRTRTHLMPGLRGVVAFGPQAAGTINGLSIHADLMLMAAEDTQCQFVVEPGYESITVTVPRTDFEAHLTARQMKDPLPPHRTVRLLQCDATKTREFFALGKRLAVTAARQPDLFNERKVVCVAAGVELVQMLLQSIASLQDYVLTRSDKTHEAYADIVQRAEKCVLAQSEVTLHVTELCKLVGVSERALEYAFKEILKTSPTAFLRRVRLHRVHQALRAGTRRTTTVSAEALKWGFWHFGDFSNDYKSCFGESPSDTLRSEPGKSTRMRKMAEVA
ncbi:MAG TPA: helix-turn-helix domain-containing protein [Candidatus Sulfotelmatobacter sp.]|nr:helix-turn-helix domain-containing protein [Candidatus Sulfotelmatobacter sp.]